jgi:hypothetical protein
MEKGQEQLHRDNGRMEQTMGKNGGESRESLAEDPERPGTMKIVDQESAEELLEMARDYLS